MHGVVDREAGITRTRASVRDEAPRRRAATSLPEVSLAAIGVYALVALVALPEGTPSPLARGIALLAIAGVTAIVVAVARWAPAWVRGAGMLLVGSAMVAVLLGVVLERVLHAPSVTSVLGVFAGLGGVCLVVTGWQRLLRGLGRRWVRVVVAVVGTLVVAQFLVLPSVVALTVTNRARPEGSGRTPADVGLVFEDIRVVTPDGIRPRPGGSPPATGRR